MKKDLNKNILKHLSTFRKLMWRWEILIKKEVKSPIRAPLFTTLWLWKNGFLTKSFVLYELNKSNIKDYVSDYGSHVKTLLINGEYVSISSNKLIFSKVLQQYKHYLPENYCLIKDEVFLPINNKFPLCTLDDVITFCHKMGRVVIKPTSGSLGRDIYVFRLMNEKLLLNHSEVTFAEVKQFLSGLDDYLVCEYIIQHEYASRLFPDTTNSLRLLTMWDYDQNIPFIAMAMHRIGTTSSIPVDNWSQGGISCSIDLETGTIGKGASYAGGTQLVWHEKHPETHSQIRGVMIPHWEDLTTKILQIASDLPFMPYLGWDVVITREGFKILEGNSSPGLNMQIHFPLLTDSRVRKFYKRFKVI